MICLILILSSFLYFQNVHGQLIYKCSPLDGSLDTYGFYVGADNGVACVHGASSGNLIMYMEKMSPDGDRLMSVAASKYDESQKKNVGILYPLFPSGPKRSFVSETQPGFIKLKFEDNEIIEMVLKPNGLAWVPADIRSINGCAQESPQLVLNVMEQQSRLSTKMIFCAMKANDNSGYNAVYGFGLRPTSTVGLEPFFALGESKKDINPMGPLDITANLFDVCLRADCRSCGAGYKVLTLSN